MGNVTLQRWVWLVAILFASSSAVVAQERFTDATAEAIELFLQEHFAEGNAGMVIGLLDDQGSRVFSAGKLDNGTDQQVDGDTVFEIGSVTKTFTSLLLLDMVRRGEMKLNDPVSKYLPKRVRVPSLGEKKITLLNLAVQDSGLPHHPDNLSKKPLESLSLKELKEGSDAFTIEDMYAFLADYELTQEPGASFRYSNIGMSLLGHAIERRTTVDYESLVLERICRPLNMSSTGITHTPELESRLARGHLLDDSRSAHFHLQGMASAGALLSTANDMLKFLSVNLGFTETHLTPLLKQSHVIRHRNSSAFGKTAMPWVDNGVYNPIGTELLGHAGGGFGNIAFVAFDKVKRRGVVVLTNQMKVYPNGIGWTLLQGMPLSAGNTAYAVRETVGIGTALELDEQTLVLRITKVYPQSPAGLAGVTAGLVIQKINGVSIEGKSMAESLGLMGGPAGKKVRLELLDPELNEIKVVELTKGKFLTSS